MIKNALDFVAYIKMSSPKARQKLVVRLPFTKKIIKKKSDVSGLSLIDSFSLILDLFVISSSFVAIEKQAGKM